MSWLDSFRCKCNKQSPEVDRFCPVGVNGPPTVLFHAYVVGRKSDTPSGAQTMSSAWSTVSPEEALAPAVRGMEAIYAIREAQFDLGAAIAQAIEARSGETEGLDPKDESAVRQDAPNE